jgi:uncharacterized protein
VTDWDAAALVVTLSRALRGAGVPVTPDRSVVAAEALTVLRPQTRDQLYWAFRTSLVASHEQVAVFNRVFAALVDGIADPSDSRGDPNAPASVGAEPGRRRADEARLRSVESGGGDTTSPWAGSAEESERSGDAGAEMVLAAASPHELLAGKSFDQLGPEELADLRRLMAMLSLSPPLRNLRRVRHLPPAETL